MNNGDEGFLLTTKFYKSTNDTALLIPKKLNPEGKAAIEPEGVATNKQENTKTKQLTTQKIHANKAPHKAQPYQRIQDARDCESHTLQS